MLGHTEVAITLDRYSHALPTFGAEAMGRLDAVLGRSPLYAPDQDPTEAASAELWVEAWSLTLSDGDKGPDKGTKSRSAGDEEARSELRSGLRGRDWYRIPDSA